MGDRSARTAPPSTTGLGGWIQRLNQRDMPVLGNTVQQLCHVSAEHDASVRDLASVVLSDPSMTSGVLKIANSAYYNTTGQQIHTISRAVIMLGFEAVRSIGLSLVVLDTFLQGKPKAKVLNLMRQAVYAAVQAKVIAESTGDRAPEEIFIATLLYRLGEMAFWTFADDAEAQTLARLVDKDGMPAAQAEMQVLGCTLRQLSAGLAKEWHLGEVLEEALQPGERRGRAAHVQLGHALEEAVRLHGWDSPAVEQITTKIAQHTRVTPERAKQIISSSKRELKKAAEAFGVSLELETGAGDPTAARPASPRPQEPEVVREPDAAVQLRVLRDLSQVLEKKPDIQVVLDMVMEGIFRGVGMDRALLAVLTPDRKALRVKYVLGDSENRLGEAFRFDLTEPDALLIRWALNQQRSIWTGVLTPAQAKQLLPPLLRERLAEDFLLGPLIVRGRDIGLIYADRRPSGRQLNEEIAGSFRHFMSQANLALEHLTRK